jgi:hypothetical protein
MSDGDTSGDRFDAYNDAFQRLGLVAGPLLLLASSIFHFLGGGMDSDDVGGILQVVAFFFLVFASFGLTELIAQQRPRLAIVLRVLLVFGCLYGVMNGLGSVLADAAGTDAAGAGIASLPSGLEMLFVYPGILFPLSLLVCGVALWRTRVVPAPAGAALALAGVLFPLGRIPDIVGLYLAADVLLVVSMGWMGLNVPTRSAALVDGGRYVDSPQ